MYCCEYECPIKYNLQSRKTLYKIEIINSNICIKCKLNNRRLKNNYIKEIFRQNS